MDIDTDLSSHKRDVAFNSVKEYLNSFGGDIVRIGTFKTDKPKSAVQTACRGLGLPVDVGMYLSSLIPVDRGQPRSIKEVVYGDEEKGFEPVKEFINQMDRYPGLLDTILGIEGLVSGRGTHACGVVISNDMLKHTATMKAPNGDIITQYDLGDSEYCGLIKYDFLNTTTLGMMQITFENLIEKGHIEWQGSLRKTYNKYLHPDNIDYNNPEYYEKLNNHELIRVFQFESGQGLKALNTVKNERSYLDTIEQITVALNEAFVHINNSRTITYKSTVGVFNAYAFQDGEEMAFGLGENVYSFVDKEVS